MISSILSAYTVLFTSLYSDANIFSLFSISFNLGWINFIFIVKNFSIFLRNIGFISITGGIYSGFNGIDYNKLSSGGFCYDSFGDFPKGFISLGGFDWGGIIWEELKFELSLT